MKISVNSVYSRIKSLTFAPEVDLTGQSVSVDEFTADIITADSISIGQEVRLYDDLDNLWARYWITYAERLDARTLRLKAKSLLVLAEQDKLPAVRFTNTLVSEVLGRVFANACKKAYDVWWLDPSFAWTRVNGFCPEQSARERLMWVCFTIGAYVKSCFSEYVEILPIDEGDIIIPLEKTFWKPSVTYRDWVTAVKAKYYSFEHTMDDPATTDKWVKDDGGSIYIVTENEATLTNPYAPSGIPDNVVSIDEMYLLNVDNVSDVLNHLAKWHFNRASVSLDVINNAEYMPGQRVIVYADETQQFSGFIESSAFAFGVQARAALKLTGADDAEGDRLVITYVWNDNAIGKVGFMFPVGYGYAVTNAYIDTIIGGHRYVFRPVNEVCMGTMVTGGVEVTEQCMVALDLYEEVLEIVSVDDVSVSDSIVTVK